MTADNPYVGPKPFEREDENKLFGRDVETRELLAIIAATPITLLYAQSGAGKTSLLKAKLQPLLERRPCEVYGPLRVASPESPSSGVKNVFTYNALLRPLRGVSLTSPRLTLNEALAQIPKPETPRGTIRMPRVLIFDQFEDLFTRYEERWEDRAPFFDDISLAIDADPRLRVVFAMREEYLASFDAYAPDLPPTNIARFRLERLRRSAAADAIAKPLEVTNVAIKPRALEKLLNNLMAMPKMPGSRAKYEEFAEALQLQIVCFNLWEATKTAHARRDPNAPVEIGTDDVKGYGDVDEALRDYYTRCVDEVTAELGKTYRFQAGKLRSWFERMLINEDGQRAMVYKGDKLTAGMPNEVVAALEKKYLIRTEPRGPKNLWCELSHERFVKPVQESNRVWRRKVDKANRGERFEALAKRWAESERPDYLLLAGTDLRDAQLWMTEQESNFGASKRLEEYLTRGAAVQQARSTKRLRFVVILSTIAVMVASYVAMQQVTISRKESALRKRERNLSQTALANAWNEIAGTMLREGRPLDALPWAIKAAHAAPDVPETGATLRNALEITSASAAWLQRPNAPIGGFEFSPDARFALTQSPNEICVWNLATGGRPICRPSPSGGYWSRAKFSRDGGFVIAWSAGEDPRPGRSAFHPTVWHSDGRAISGRIPVIVDPWLVDGCGEKNLLIVGRANQLSLFNTVTGQERSAPLSRLPLRGDIAADCSSIVTSSIEGIVLWSRTLGKRDLEVDKVWTTFGDNVTFDASFDERGENVLLQVVILGYVHQAIVFNTRTGLRLLARDFSVPIEKVVLAGRWLVAEGELQRQRVLDYYEVGGDKHEGRVQDLSNETVMRGPVANIAVTRSGNTSVLEVLDLATRVRSRVTIPDAGFNDLTISHDVHSLMTQKNGIVRVWKLAAGPVKIDESTPSQLLARACAQLKRFGYDDSVESECRSK